MDKWGEAEGRIVLTRQQVRAFDAWAIQELGIPGVVLMENAGRSCAELLKQKLADDQIRDVCIFCGTGNNGGDGYVIARHLLNAGYRVTVALCGPIEKVRGDAKVNLDILVRLGQRIERVDVEAEDLCKQVGRVAEGAGIVVDALFGTGLRGVLNEPYQRLVRCINELGRPILAVDIPSGLDCDTGQVLGAAIRARWTVSFAAIKRGFVQSEDVGDYTGEVYVASIGVEPDVWLAAGG